MSNIATREAYGKALVKLGDLRGDVVVLDADLSKSTKTSEFAKTFPTRFFNMGIAEQNLIGAACGLATAGKIPFASTFAMFATGRGFEIIRNSVCYPNLNVKICATHAGISVGEDGASHQSVEDIAIMRSIPNMTVLVPCDAIETEKMIFEIVKYNGPVYVRLGRSAVPQIFGEDYDFEIGKGVILREGSDATIIACGMMVNEAINASKLLKEEGINVRVINMSTIKPIDKEVIIESAKKTGAIVTVEEHSVIGGLGSAVSDVVSENYPVLVKKIGINDVFGQSGKPKQLMEEYGLTVENIINKVKEAIQTKQ
ncbi:MAG: transketolase family protein [Intestinibacter sp.]|uniref:transketolase family protein n=1 Tax=Intestinibacter sp. TaxID=1965304 RepID=UPI0025B95AA2|nr:transketolase family protein [Intestinibacter sp.]MCI6737949.1 transketolase family protein [Intestinibacter sp.]